MLKTIIVLLIAVIPAVIWLYLFLAKHKLSKWMVAYVFVGGMIAAKLILVYQGYWDQTINLIFFKVSLVDFRSNIESLIVNTLLSTFVIFLGVGVMEEFAKFWIMKLISKRHFKSIDDVIEFAIIAALGFAFFENIVYFGQNWGNLSTGNFFAFALMRVTIVTMVHMLCSGILGYYYGMAFFASPMLKIQYMKKHTHPVLRFFKKIFGTKQSQLYYEQMFVTGLLLSMLVHAMYDFLLTIKFSLFGLPMLVPIMFLYFFGGFWYLNRLFRKKDLNLKLGLVGTNIMPEEDFVKLIDEIHAIKEKMETETNNSN